MTQEKFVDRNSVENAKLFKCLMGIIESAKESLQLKKVNLLGCKMKIYQERMRQVQFLEILSRYKTINQIENIH